MRLSFWGTTLALALALSPVLSSVAWGDPEDETDAVVAPETIAQSRLETELRRRSGQTSYVTAHRNYRAMRMATAESALASPQSDAKGGTAKRDVLESDVFAVDPDTKVLYLLNSQRGLQAVSSQNELLGRAPASGNHPENMYLVKSGGKKRLVVLEHDYQKRYENEEGDPMGRVKTQIVVYDITDPAHPKLDHTLPLEGYMADSRIVGDVLYVATSVWNYGYYGYSADVKPKGKVFAVSLTGEKVAQVGEAYEIGLPQVSPEMMQIVENKVGEGKYSYHLLALTPGQQERENRWTWWNRGSSIEVIDITDPAGKIAPVFKVDARGYVGKKNQMTVKDGHLIAASNYVAREGANRWSPIRRVAVESWALPTGEKAKDKPLPKQEADFRRLSIERTVAGARLPDEEAREARRAELTADARTGLQGRFFQMEEKAPLTKLVPDSVATTGDTTGQSANLQDARFDGDDLYAFWVPGNLIDPLDKFSTAGGKVKYEGRLQFDGWVETSRIFHHQNRTFILGLGFTVPVESERNRRFPQAKLFEVVREGTGYVTRDVASVVLKDHRLWPALSGADKFIDARVNADGLGSTMFTVSAYTERGYVQGGKLIGFDLNAAIAGDKDKVFTEGALLAGNTDYLRRVFVDSVTMRRLAFSDRQLADYGTVERGVGSAAEVREAAQRLELARNIRGYVAMGPRLSLGVQIVSDASYWWQSGPQTTQLRLVTDEHADAELAQVLKTYDLDGNYRGHTLIDHGTATPPGKGRFELVVLTEKHSLVDSVDVNDNPWEAQGSKEWETHYKVFSMTFHDGELKPQAQASWKVSEGRYWWGGYGSSVLGPITRLEDGSLVVSAGQKLQRLVQNGDKYDVSAFTIEGAPAHVQVSQSLVRLGGSLHLTWYTPVKVEGRDADKDSLEYRRMYTAPVTLEGGTWKLGTAVNIPGSPIAFVAAGGAPPFLLTQEGLLQDRYRVLPAEDETAPAATIVGRRRRAPVRDGEPLLVEYIQSVRIAEGKATLADLKPADGRRIAGLRQLGAHGPLMDMKKQDQQGGWGGIRPMMFMPGRMPYFDRSSPASIEFLSVTDAGLLRWESRVVDGMTLTNYPQLVDLFADPRRADIHYAIVMEGNQLQVLEIDGKTWHARVLRVVPVNERGERTTPVPSLYVPNTYAWGFGSSRLVSFNPQQRNFVVAAGLPGNCQFYLAKEGAGQ